jgi:hypothetical protein
LWPQLLSPVIVLDVDEMFLPFATPVRTLNVTT